MRIFFATFLCLFFSFETLAQDAKECPPGPFSCVPWTSPGAGSPSPAPPPPFFEVLPEFIQADSFSGYVGVGNQDELKIQPGGVPTGALESLKPYRDIVDPNRLYVMPKPIENVPDDTEYLLFKGIDIK